MTKTSVALRGLAGAVLAAIIVAFAAAPAYAIPALQLGPGTGNWTYDLGSQTWVTNDDPFNVVATANAKGKGSNGAYAWDKAGSSDQYAYLVLAATPMTQTDGFDVVVTNNGSTLALVASGYGTPPVNDPNSIAPHGIFDTYFEIYEFKFDEAKTTISDTQPGGTGTGDGYIEAFDVDVVSLSAGVTGIHVDLFTVTGAQWDPNAAPDKEIVNAVAPFSHDAQFGPPPPVVISEPASLAILGLGLLGLGSLRRRRRRAR